MKEQYDFFAIGKKHFIDDTETIRKMAMEYQLKFGRKAREEFESGVYSQMSQYANAPELRTGSAEEALGQGGSNNYGVPNTRNNSYFGGRGTGVQYQTRNGIEYFNEPNVRESKKK